jgi:hypothetical protein
VPHGARRKIRDSTRTTLLRPDEEVQAVGADGLSNVSLIDENGDLITDLYPRALLKRLHAYHTSHGAAFRSHHAAQLPSIVTVTLPARLRLIDNILPLLAELFFVRLGPTAVDFNNRLHLQDETVTFVGSPVAVRAATTALSVVSSSPPAEGAPCVSSGVATDIYIRSCSTSIFSSGRREDCS